MIFDELLRRWDLTPDGDPIVTHSSQLLPVCRGDQPAMLKVATEPEETRGGAVMVWWEGEGAARVLAHHGAALLLERATGTRSLIEMVRAGQDDAASRIICGVVARLHAPRDSLPPSLVPLAEWFRELWPAAEQYSGILRRSAETARLLLADQREVVVLHGDIHHGNILDFGPHGWLAIDPKGLIGERGFDFANTFCNPHQEMITVRERVSRTADVISAAAQFDRTRLLQWVLAYAGLSAAWFLGGAVGDPASAQQPIAIAELAAEELDQN
ncbi:MAG TPA: aminoglycoside phosphotransferase family protein [Thermomicrobiales bacterium]|nr:aminoglycoside phosphotransferase family protein [Thermomicrobiales bacterium]